MLDTSMATSMVKSLVPLLFFVLLFQLSSAHAARSFGHLNTDSTCHVSPPPATDTTSVICVDKSGCCNFTTVQAAVNAVEVNSQKRTIIWINSGTYTEKVMIPEDKPNITFQGQGFQTTEISWNDTSRSSNGTFKSASVQVFAPNFIAKNITFKNFAPPPRPGDDKAQAVAIKISGDKAAFWGCGFYGYQDTLHDDMGRHYFRDCYIQGSIDFIFGDGRSLYENCQLNSVASPNGAVTAQRRNASNENTGFAFVNCSIGGTGNIWLGRAWGRYSRVVFAHTSMTQIISPDGWSNMDNPTYERTVFYGEYKNTGVGANMSRRVNFTKSLSDAEAAPFLTTSFIDGDQWLQPYA